MDKIQWKQKSNTCYVQCIQLIAPKQTQLNKNTMYYIRYHFVYLRVVPYMTCFLLMPICIIQVIKCDCRKSWPIFWNLYCTIFNIPAIKSLLNPNANGRDLYHDTTCRSECCTVVVKLRVNWQSFYFCYKTYIPRVLYIIFVCLNTLIRKTRGIYNTYLDNIVDIY